MVLMALLSNFVLPARRVVAKPKHPNTFNCVRYGRVPWINSYGDLNFKKGLGSLLMICVACFTTKDQNAVGRWDWKSKAQLTLSKCWCFLSTILFCCGVSTQYVSWIMPLLLKKSVIRNSFALSDLIRFNFKVNWVSIYWTKPGKIVLTSDLCFKRCIHVKRDKSSTTVKRYLKPSREEIARGSHTSTWINSKKDELLLLLWGKDNFFCLAKWHVSQGWEQWKVMSLYFVDKCFKMWSEVWLNLWCHNVDRSLETTCEKESLDWKPLICWR